MCYFIALLALSGEGRAGLGQTAGLDRYIRLTLLQVCSFKETVTQTDQRPRLQIFTKQQEKAATFANLYRKMCIHFTKYRYLVMIKISTFNHKIRNTIQSEEL